MIKKGELKKIKFNRRYRPIDNSHATCLNDGTNHYLAGTSWTPHTEVEIMLGPYVKKMDCRYFKELEFVIVRDNVGNLHEIMYHKHGEI
jgi:hypothetical protein